MEKKEDNLTQSKLDHSVDAVWVRLRIIQWETRGKQCGLKQQDDQILHSFVVFIRIGLLPQGLHDGMIRVDLQVFLGHHVAHGGVVPQGLGLHDPLHVGRPAVGAGHDTAGRRNQPVWYGDLEKNQISLRNGN